MVAQWFLARLLLGVLLAVVLSSCGGGGGGGSAPIADNMLIVPNISTLAKNIADLAFTEGAQVTTADAEPLSRLSVGFKPVYSLTGSVASPTSSTNQGTTPCPAQTNVDMSQGLLCGLMFDPVSRKITGTPSGYGTLSITYAAVASQADGDTTPSESYTITVVIQAQRLGGAIEFAIEQFVVSDPALGINEPLDLTAVVRNQGTTAATVPAVSFYRSGDATIDPATDTLVGSGLSTATGDLASLASRRYLSNQLTAPTVSGVYYYGACVAETAGEDTSNNCSSGVSVTVASPSDLYFSTALGAPAGAGTGGILQLTATVGNQGTGSNSSNARVRYYQRNANTDISIGTVLLNRIAGNTVNGQALSFDATAPSTANTYEYYACIEGTDFDNNSSNDCTSTVQVSVVNLLAVAIAANPASLVTGQSFTLVATVVNSGSTSMDTTLTFYRSADQAIDSNDTVLGVAQSITGLAGSGGTTSISMAQTAPSTAGDFYYYACVGNTGTRDNCSSVLPVSVLEPIVLSAGTLSVSYADGSFTLTTEIGNSTLAPVNDSVEFYRSDTAITGSPTPSDGTEVGTVSFSGLTSAADQRVTSPSLSLPAPATNDYYYFACTSLTLGGQTAHSCSPTIRITELSAP